MSDGAVGKGRKGRILRRVGIAGAVLLLAAMAGATVYMVATFKIMAYQGDRVAYDYLHVGSDLVAVDRQDRYIFFDGPGQEVALVFYPGAAIEAEAYAPLMELLAESGTDCYLMRMPLNCSLLGLNRFSSVYEEGKYGKWIIAGHSLGGVAAAFCASLHKAELDGLIFLASFPGNDLRKTGLPVLSVMASEDGILDSEDVKESRKYLPEDTTDVMIEGGNHSGFGSYGEQDGDRRATIPQSQQWEETILAINDFEAALN